MISATLIGMSGESQEAFWEPVDATRAATIANQLGRELSPGHSLHGKAVKVIGFRTDQDDVLLHLSDTNEWAICHLTWQGRQQPPWPHTIMLKPE